MAYCSLKVMGPHPEKLKCRIFTGAPSVAALRVFNQDKMQPGRKTTCNPADSDKAPTDLVSPSGLLSSNILLATGAYAKPPPISPVQTYERRAA